MSRLVEKLHLLLLAAVTPMMFVSLWMVFLYAPEERTMGAVQRVFYFHVPSAMMTYASVAVLLAASLAYLWTRDRRWDNLSLAATECGLLFCTIVLITGPIWARPIWNTWWTWEVRLTATLLLWIILAASLMVRGYAENRDLAARLAAVLGVVAALDLPIIKVAVRLWGGMHPQVFKPGKDSGLEPTMLRTWLVCIVTFLLLFLLLLAVRYRQAELDERLERVSRGVAGG